MQHNSDQPPVNILIRPIHCTDAAPAFAAIEESRTNVGTWMPDLAAVPSIEAVDEWISAASAARESGLMFHFAIVETTSDSFLGGCGLTYINETHHFANLYYWVRSSQLRRGIASRATRLLAAWGFEYTQLQRIEIVAAVGNAASLRVAEKAGAKREGVLRNRIWAHHRPHDAYMFSLTPDDL